MNFMKALRVRTGKGRSAMRGDPDATFGLDKAEAHRLTAENQKRIGELTGELYAEGRRSLLVCLQAPDAGGKDGAVASIAGPMNAAGVTVTSFKVPSAEEKAHDYLWRYHKAMPRRGQVAVFNRTHYESVLVERVHDLAPKKVWSKRYAQINAFEAMLAVEGTTIVKFFLHISKEEQLERFKSRLDDPAKNWKISEADYTERDLWDSYSQAFADAMSECSTEIAPWYVIPANHKWLRDLAVTDIVRRTLKAMKIAEPQPSVDLEEIRRKYHAAAGGA